MKKRILSFVIILTLILSIGMCAFADSNATSAKNGVAVICTWLETENGQVELLGSGTCFFIGKTGEAPKYLITAHHCVEDYIDMYKGDWVGVSLSDDQGNVVDSTNVKFYAGVYYDSPGSGDYDEAYLVDYDEQQDYAVLRLEKPTDKRIALPLQIANDDNIGELVHTIGYPGLADNLTLDPKSLWGVDDSLTTTGTIGRYITISGPGTEWIAVSNTDWNHGNSGGPVLSEKGGIIGIASKVQHDELSNMCLAVNIERVLPTLDKNNIEYTMVGAGLPMWLIIAAAVVVVALVVLIILVISKSKKGSAKPAAAKGKKGKVEEKEKIATVRSLAAQHGGARLKVNGRTIMIGRDPSCNIAFSKDTPGVSGVHCSLSFDEASGDFVLTDLKSSYGTFLATGQKLNPNMPYRLRRGDSFYLAERSNLFQLDVE